MIAAAIHAYNVGLFIHILAAVVALGMTFGYGFFVAFAQANHREALPGVLRAITAANRYVVTPGLIVVLLAGIYLVNKSDEFKASDSFVGVGIVAVIVLLGMIHGYFRPNEIKAAELAERDLAAGGGFSPEFEAVSRKLDVAGRIAGLIIVVTIFFMAVQP
jgi:hypothetical protein